MPILTKIHLTLICPFLTKIHLTFKCPISTKIHLAFKCPFWPTSHQILHATTCEISNPFSDNPAHNTLHTCKCCTLSNSPSWPNISNIWHPKSVQGRPLWFLKWSYRIYYFRILVQIIPQHFQIPNCKFIWIIPLKFRFFMVWN